MMMLVTLHKQTTEQKMVMEMEVEKREEIQKMSRINIYNTYISFVGKTNMGEKMSEIISSPLTRASGYTYLQWCHSMGFVLFCF